MAANVLTLELLRGGRRSRNHTLRWCYAGWLTLQFDLLLFAFSASTIYAGERNGYLTEACRNYVEILVVQQFVLLLLVVPGALAGAVTDEKTRGTLPFLLTTDLTVGEILLGKLVARAGWVGTLALLPLPLLCLAAPFAGLDLLELLTLAVCTVVLIFSLGAVGLLASVWARKTSSAMIGLYCCLGVGYVALQVAAGNWVWLQDRQQFLDPTFPLDLDEPSLDLRQRGTRLLGWMIPWLALGLVSFGLAVWRMLPAYLRQLESVGRKRWFAWATRRPSVQGNPVAWKERYVEGIAPLPFLRALPTWLAVVSVFLLTVLAYGSMVFYRINLDAVFELDPEVSDDEAGTLFERVLRLQIPVEEFFGRSVAVLLIAALLVGIRCSGAVTGERERKTWESLLLSPLETRQLIRGKFWGILGATYPYLIAYAVPALAFAPLGGWIVVPLTLLFLGVTWLAMAYVGAAGIWSSVESNSSWHSLLRTLVLAYLGGTILYCVATPVAMALVLFVVLILAFVEYLLGGSGLDRLALNDTFGILVAVGVGLAFSFALASWRFLTAAENHVGRKERVENGRDKEEFVRPQSRGQHRQQT
jgi:ABC-type transport system involved in multi-copper enzyme maturation permease subunit